MSDTSNEIPPWRHTATVQDVAARYNVNPATVYNWLKSPNPPPHRKLGGEYRFDLLEVDGWSAPSEELAS